MCMNGHELYSERTGVKQIFHILINLMMVEKICQIKHRRVLFAVAAGASRPGSAGSRPATGTRPTPGTTLSGFGSVFPRGQLVKVKEKKERNRKQKDRTNNQK